MLKDKILLVEDEAALRQITLAFLENRNYEVLVAGTCDEAVQLVHTARPDAAILDYTLPDGSALDLIPRLRAADPTLHLIILTGFASIESAVEAVKLGAEHFLTKPIELATLSLILQRCIENQKNRQKQMAEKTQLRRSHLNPFLGGSPVIASLAEAARRAVSSEDPILIEGEAGTGKGVLARWLHQNGPRSAAPFVSLNARDLSEADFFGHEPGGGLTQGKTGLLEIAHKGTIFLDEIGDLDSPLQPRLLKALDEKKFHRPGEAHDRHVDIHLIASTRQDLARRVRDKSFRSDFYFRITMTSLVTPPLRERLEDVPALTANVLGKLASDLGSGQFEITTGAMRMLQSYSWPGNIRELRNVLERAVLVNGSHTVTEKDLHFEVEAAGEDQGNVDVIPLEDMERQYIEKVLHLEGGRVEPAARRLGIPRSSLYHKLKQYRASKLA